MATNHCTQDNQPSLSPSEIRLIHSFRKLQSDDCEFIVGLTYKMASDRPRQTKTKSGPLKLVAAPEAPRLSVEKSKLMESFDKMVPADREALVKFAAASALENPDINRPGLRLVATGRA